jgi:Ca2+-binding RTX toxin-like protein
MVDVPANTTTTAILETALLNGPVGLELFGTYSGRIDAPGDHDWVRVNLTAGKTYFFYLSAEEIGAGGGDSFLSLRNASGTQVAFDDDGGVADNSFLPFPVTATGTYYIDVSLFSPGERGTYSVLMTDSPVGVNVFQTAGHDNVSAGENNEWLIGGAGDDILNLGGAGLGHAALGEQGHDLLVGTGINDVLSGGLGSDFASGSGGNDVVLGDAGDDRLNGGNGDDQVFGGDGFDDLFGDANNDRLFGGADEDFLYGSTGNDVLNGGSGDDTLDGGDGFDTLDGGAGNDTVKGLAGNDAVNVTGTNAQFDAFNGGTGSDKIKVLGITALTLNGFNAASQSIEVWEGNGKGLLGSANANVFNLAGLTTKTGLASISGLGGNDTITGSKFADTIAAQGTEAQFDTMNGGLGIDTFRVDGSGAVTLNGFNAASQSIEVWDGNGQGLLGNGSANVLNLAGLTGVSDLPVVNGEAGNDTITGSKFADAIRGGPGVDTMTGGLGGDRFDFDDVAEIGKNQGLLDGITDWGDGDTIDLSSIDANGSKKGDKAWKFLKKEGAAFTKAGQVGFDQKKAVTYVQGDLNGDGKADFKIEVAGKIDFVKADFVL